MLLVLAPLLLGAALTCASMALLGIASLGVILVIGLMFTLLCTLVVLPALIEWREAAVKSFSNSPGRSKRR
jgi:predicted RND superfamily exporter protein